MKMLCHLRRHCQLAAGLDETEYQCLGSILQILTPLSRGAWAYRVGDRQRGLYVIRSGSVKTLIVKADGREQVTGFHLPGDLVGLDSLFETRYLSSARILERSVLCRLPIADHDRLLIHHPALGQRLLHALSQRLREDQQHRVLLAQARTEQRFAIFLLTWSQRLAARGFHPRQFPLHMSRTDRSNCARGRLRGRVSSAHVPHRPQQLFGRVARDLESAHFPVSESRLAHGQPATGAPP